MARVAASVLSADEARLWGIVKAVEEAGADELHLDIMDGRYVPAKKFGPGIVRELRAGSGLYFDVHLMVSKPDDVIEEYVDAGANAITFHVETADEPGKTIETIRWHGLRAGIALNSGVSVEKALPFLQKADLVLVMTVEAGRGGQEFIEKNLDKVRKLREVIGREHYRCIIAVDGGIDAKTGRLAAEAGADMLCAGSYIVHAKNMEDAVEALKKL